MKASTVLYISERSSSGPEMISGVRASSTRMRVDLVDDRVVVTALHHLTARSYFMLSRR